MDSFGSPLQFTFAAATQQVIDVVRNRLTIGTSDEWVPALALAGNKDPDFGRPHDDGGADDANYGTNGPGYIRIIRQNYWRALRLLREACSEFGRPLAG